MEQVTYQDLNPKLDNSGFHVVLCGFFNIFSVRLTTAVQNIFTVFKMLALTIIIVMGAVQIFRGKIRTTFHLHGSNYTLDCRPEASGFSVKGQFTYDWTGSIDRKAS